MIDLRLKAKAVSWASVALIVLGVPALTFPAIIFLANLEGRLQQMGGFLLWGFSCFLLYQCSRALWQKSKRFASASVNLQNLDSRLPVLYLRSHAVDGLERPGVSWMEWGATEEEELAFALSRIGPVLALDPPGQQLPEIGALRLNPAEQEWRAVVQKLMSRSILVLIRVGYSPNLLWEFDQAMTLVEPTRLVLYIGSAEHTGVDQDMRSSWSRFREHAESRHRISLPELPRIKNPLYVYFSSDWKPHLEAEILYLLESLGLARRPGSVGEALDKLAEPLFGRHQGF